MLMDRQTIHLAHLFGGNDQHGLKFKVQDP
jgi:hypothetical protein